VELLKIGNHITVSDRQRRNSVFAETLHMMKMCFITLSPCLYRVLYRYLKHEYNEYRPYPIDNAKNGVIETAMMIPAVKLRGHRRPSRCGSAAKSIKCMPRAIAIDLHAM
jgi:hypothetical protein